MKTARYSIYLYIFVLILYVKGTRYIPDRLNCGDILPLKSFGDWSHCSSPEVPKGGPTYVLVERSFVVLQNWVSHRVLDVILAPLKSQTLET